MKRRQFTALAIGPLAIFLSIFSSGEAAFADTATYVGSNACADCHQAEAGAWADSHHSWALREATGENVLGDFNGATFRHLDVESRFSTQDDSYFVETDGPDGSIRTFQILYTIGVTPLQQYGIETENGRIQALDIAWDTENERWFHLYPEDDVSAGNGFHWTGPYKSWQARCAVCHQTGFQKSYSLESDSYSSSWQELTVGCEACHGPGSEHAAAAIAPGGYNLANSGFRFAFTDASAGLDPEIDACGGCHSRRTALDEGSVAPGEGYAQSYELALLRPRLYHPDGQIEAEVYVLGSFFQSRMYEEGVRCTNCHDPHSAQLVTEGNAICTQCHNDVGREEFPTLKPANYDSEAHHRHTREGAGGQCVACHMPETTYMTVDPRRDHSFRIPRPDLSVSIGVPNACTGCHEGETSRWAADQINLWYPEGRQLEPGFGPVFHAAEPGLNQATEQGLLSLAINLDEPAIVRATAVSMLGGRPDDLVPLLGNPSALVRTAAVRALAAASPAFRAEHILPLVRDDERSVRLAATLNTANLPPDLIQAELLEVLAEQRSDLRRSYEARADFPETHMQLGGLALSGRDIRNAEAAFQRAVSMDPQLIDAWLMRSEIAMAVQDRERAVNVLTEAVSKNPDEVALYRALANTQAATGDVAGAGASLERAAVLAPSDPAIAVDLAFVMLASGQAGRAVGTLEPFLNRHREDLQFMEAWLTILVQAGDLGRASETVQQIRRDHAGHIHTPQMNSLMRLFPATGTPSRQ